MDVSGLTLQQDVYTPIPSAHTHIYNCQNICVHAIDSSLCCVCRCLAQRACEVLTHTDIYNIYGPTEATIWVSSWRCNGGNFKGVATSPIGGPMANTHLYVLDEELQPVLIGELVALL